MKWQYFFLDQCYWVHAALIITSVARIDNLGVLQTLFALSNGPILLAIFMWRNSLALHNFDKSTSTFLHLMPAAVTWSWSWFGHERASALWSAPRSPLLVLTVPNELDGPRGGFWQPDLWGLYCRPLACYCAWQFLYFVKTEVLDREILAADQELMTCQRWIMGSSSWLKHPFVEWCGKFFVRREDGAQGGLGGTGADTWSKHRDSTWAGVIYTVGNFVYESASMLLAIPLYHSYHLHTSALIIATAYSVWNAGTWYTDRFPAMVAAEAQAAARGRKAKAG